MADKLTPQQRQAVEDRGGMLLVSAAAGSGKTKVLVDRLLRYLTDPSDPADLDEFLIITYTKAAASELRGKIAAKLTEAIAAQPENRHLQRQMQRLFLTKISTVHGFCADVLREYAYRLDLSGDFRVADENECREIRETVLTDLLDQEYARSAEDPDFRAFVDTQGLGRTDALVSEIIQKVYDSARCHLDPEGWLDQCIQAAQVEDCDDAAQTLWGSFLVGEFFDYLDQQIHVFDRCATLAERSGGLLKQVQILRDTQHQLEHLRGAKTWDEIVERSDIDYGRLTFPKKDVDTELIERIKACRDACKKGLAKQLKPFSDDSVTVIGDLSSSAAATRGLVALVRRFGKAYEQAKRSRRCLDFSDLEHKMLDLVLGTSRSGPTAAAREIGNRFREIMVDEYQDSNGVQDAIFGAMTRERNNCFMVGDVKQSIYQFRLADPSIFLEKYNHFVPAAEATVGQGRKVLLSANFRSGPEVVSAVNDVFIDCMNPRVGGLIYGEEEMLREGIPHDDLPDAGVELYGIDVSDDTYEEEATFVAQRIAQMLRSGTLVRGADGLRPVMADDIVILLRSPGSVGEHFRQALESRGIRCTSGGGTDLLKTQEVATLRSVLQTVANPRQDIPLISALASPVFGFTADDLAAIRSKKKRGCVYDALLESDWDKVARFLDILAKLRSSARMNPVSRVIEDVFALTRMDSIYGAMPEGQSKVSNLQTFYTLASQYETTSRRELSQFLDYIDCVEEKGLKTEGEHPGGAVTIMSIHKSKGLEFPVVFLCGLGRVFNRESLRAQVLCDKDLRLGLSVADTTNRVRYPALSKRAISAKISAESLSEEMRVLYVAMTRARDRLVMTYASQNLQKHLAELALRYDICGAELLTREAVCPGEWVLLSALLRREAGEFHNLGARPDQTRSSRYPWKIRVVSTVLHLPDAVEQVEETDMIPEGAEEKLAHFLGFRYPHLAATQAPSKQTATQRKGRIKDTEAAEQAQEPKPFRRTWRAPAFAGEVHDGTRKGTAMHTFMQYVRYENCSTIQGIQEELARLVSSRFLLEEQAAMVDCHKAIRFFESPLGQKLMKGVDHIREFKFSLLDGGEHYGEGLETEQVLLQGVVDCAIMEDDGITVMDFKTDYVTEETLEEAVDRYRGQVQVYSQALERIYGRPIKESNLYFFELDRFVRI